MRFFLFKLDEGIEALARAEGDDGTLGDLIELIPIGSSFCGIPYAELLEKHVPNGFVDIPDEYFDGIADEEDA